MENVYCPHCDAANPPAAARCTRCSRPFAAAAVAVPVTGLARRRTFRPLREPMEERLLWALALALATFLGIAALVNIPAPLGLILGGLLLPVSAAGMLYRYRRCDMFARRRARVDGRSVRPGMLIVWGWAFGLLLLLPGWRPGTPPDAALALAGAALIGLLVLDEWRGLFVAATAAAAYAGAYAGLMQLAPGLAARAQVAALLALVLWFAAVWLSETHRRPD